jgi:hypothetical protein
MSTTDFFREPVRFLKESNTQESMMEKPYLEDEYPKMHLKLPDFKFKPREIPSIFGPIADGDPFPGLAMIDFGDAKCHWDITNVGYCTEGPVIITMFADYFWRAEFDFIALITKDTIGVSLLPLAPTEACSWDEQAYLLIFPDNASGSVTVCGSASANVLISQTFETVVAGMPVGIHLVGGSLMAIERGQSKPATLIKSAYGTKGDNCGCITLSSSCAPACGCKSIGYSTKSMAINEEQTVSVVDPDGECTYNWFISGGGGGLSSPSGTSVVYTAPGSNENCDNNPSIVLQIEGSGEICDTLNIAINAYTGDEFAVYANGVGCPSAVPYGGALCGDYVCATNYCWQCCVNRMTCDGAVVDTIYSTSCSGVNENSCGENWCGTYCSDTSMEDKRTGSMITQGCCPPGV